MKKAGEIDETDMERRKSPYKVEEKYNSTSGNKRGDQEEVGHYRGISLLRTAYKVYAEVLRMRLKKVIEEKKQLQKNLVP